MRVGPATRAGTAKALLATGDNVPMDFDLARGSAPRRPLLGRVARFVLLPAGGGALVGLAALWIAGKGPRSAAEATSYAQAVARAAPAVVNLYSQRPRNPLCGLPAFRNYCQRLERYNRHMRGALGSGVIMREDGYVLTNHHVIAAGEDIVVAFHDGGEARAAIVGTDPITDLAVVKVEGNGYPTIEYASMKHLRVGDIVLAIGNPFGIGQAVSQGIISAKGRGLGETPYDFLQTDAAVNPGNSGGALVDPSGRLLGINTLLYSRSGGSEGVGFAIPLDRALRVLDEIIKHGQALHGAFGVALFVDPDPGSSGGPIVTYVEKGSQAHRAGLRFGDQVLAVNGQAVGTQKEFVGEVLTSEPGSPLSIRIWRNGAVRVLETTTGLLRTNERRMR